MHERIPVLLSVEFSCQGHWTFALISRKPNLYSSLDFTLTFAGPSGLAVISQWVTWKVRRSTTIITLAPVASLRRRGPLPLCVDFCTAAVVVVQLGNISITETEILWKWNVHYNNTIHLIQYKNNSKSHEGSGGHHRRGALAPAHANKNKNKSHRFFHRTRWPLSVWGRPSVTLDEVQAGNTRGMKVQEIYSNGHPAAAAAR